MKRVNLVGNARSTSSNRHRLRFLLDFIVLALPGSHGVDTRF